ncbi:hypothetical protein THAOC_07646 [Thalassiosira oceanica]|uniref:Uncharacterized protein n=1 Tax=Thalassiosira oceanica TaxID=159749 RepID=K0TJY6_THAOC|nr:hypothetical protein THAOC_07646 [Thalassiosira oceanica]|eukprot:EJK70957.1 hypothetical protein THAOC_07646 [Thalassiosira oceanica]
MRRLSPVAEAADGRRRWPCAMCEMCDSETATNDGRLTSDRTWPSRGGVRRVGPVATRIPSAAQAGWMLEDWRKEGVTPNLGRRPHTAPTAS